MHVYKWPEYRGRHTSRVSGLEGLSRLEGGVVQIRGVVYSCLPDTAGVKEAFLKLAQAVVSLHQQNQLSGAVVEPSYSPLSSYTTQQQYSALNHLANGNRDLKHHEPMRVTHAPTTDDSRCCTS